MKIVSEKENKLLKRKEMKVFFSDRANTLSRIEIKAELVKKLKVDKNLLIIGVIKAHFGSRNFDVEVFVYEDIDSLKKGTSVHIYKRNNPIVEEAEA